MFKMIGRKTLKRLTRFGLCFYIFSYCMAFTVCAESFPTLEPGAGDAGITAPEVTGVEANEPVVPAMDEAGASMEDPAAEAGTIEPEAESSEEPEILGGYGGYNRYIEYTGNNVTGLFNELWVTGVESFSVMANLTQNLVLTNQSLIVPVKRTGDVLIDGKGHTIEGNRVAGQNLDQRSLMDFTWFEELTFENTVFKNFDGSVIYDNHYVLSNPIAQQLTFINCTFINNTGDKGGVVYINDTSSVFFEDCTFINNVATNGGGVAYVDYEGRLHAEECKFINNSATGGDGGAVFITGDGSLSVTNSTFLGNTIPSGKKGSAIWCNASSGSVGVSVGGNIFLKNSGDPVLFFGNKGSYEVGNVWFGHTEKDYNRTFNAVEGVSPVPYRFLNLSSYVHWYTGEYSMEVDPRFGYNPSNKSIYRMGSWNLPDTTLNCGSKGCTLKSSSFTILYNDSSSSAPTYVPITGFTDAAYTLSLPDLGYSKDFRREITNVSMRDRFYYDENNNPVVPYYSNNMYQVRIDDNTAAAADKTVNVLVKGLGSYSFKTGSKGDGSFNNGGNFSMNFGANAVPGNYSVTYSIDGLDPFYKNITVSKADTYVSYINGTAEDLGDESGKPYLYEPFNYESGSGDKLRVYIRRIESSGPINRGMLTVYNGYPFDESNTVTTAEIKEGAQCVEIPFDSFDPGQYNLTGSYKDRTGCFSDALPNKDGTSSFAEPLLFNITDSRSAAGVSFTEGTTINKAVGDPEFRLNVSVKDPGTGDGTYSWLSKKPSVAEVSDDGMISVKSAGKTTIKVRYGSETTSGSAEITLIVEGKNDPDDPSNAQVSFAEGTSIEKELGSGAFTLNVTAANPGNNGHWSFESSNESVAAVDEKGLVSLKAVGVTNITATYGSDSTYGSAVILLTVKPANVFPVPVNGSVVQNQTFSFGTGGEGEEVSLQIWYTSNVSFTGSKFKAKEIEDLGNGSYSVGGVVIKLNSTLTEVAKPNFKFKNTKYASDNTKCKKQPCFIISFKANSGISKENKTDVKTANKALKKKPVEFRIEQADISQASEGKVYMNPKKTKVKKAEMSISGNKLTLNKKDYDAAITEKDVTLMGKGNYKGNLTLPLPG